MKHEYLGWKLPLRVILHGLVVAEGGWNRTVNYRTGVAVGTWPLDNIRPPRMQMIYIPFEIVRREGAKINIHPLTTSRNVIWFEINSVSQTRFNDVLMSQRKPYRPQFSGLKKKSQANSVANSDYWIFTPSRSNDSKFLQNNPQFIQ